MNNKKILIWIFAAVALIGITDAGYLTYGHFSGDPLSCGLTGGCETVTTSEYATILGVPVALLGLLYYLTVFLSTMFALDTKNTKLKTTIFRFMPLLTTTGLLASAWFLYVQAFILESYCQYCLLSAATSTLLFILSFFLFSKKQSQ